MSEQDLDGVNQKSVRSLHDPNVEYPHAHEVIKNWALEVTQLMFAEGNPTGHVWSADQAKTGIFVVDKYTFNLDQVGTCPTIVANRGPIQWTGSSGFRQLQSLDFRTGRRVHTDLVRGGVVLSCFARHGLEAETIAGHVWEGFQVLRDVLRKLPREGSMVPSHLGFFRIEATSMGEEALVQGDSRPDMSVVPVSISAMVQRRYAVTPNARKLENIFVRTSRSGS